MAKFVKRLEESFLLLRSGQDTAIALIWIATSGIFTSLSVALSRALVQDKFVGEGARVHAKKLCFLRMTLAVGLLTIPSSEILVECAISTRGENGVERRHRAFPLSLEVLTVVDLRVWASKEVLTSRYLETYA